MKISWLLGGNIVYAFSQWLVLLVLSNKFSQEDVGGYFFSLALVSPIMIFVSLKLSNLIVTLKKEDTGKNNIYSFKNVLDIFLILIVFIIYFTLFRSNTDIVSLTAVLIYKILEQRDDLAIAYYQRDFSFKEIFYLKFMRSIFYTFLIFLFSYFLHSLEYVLIASTLVYACYWVLRNYNNIYISKISREIFFLYINNGWTLSASAAISSLSVSGVRIYIGYILGGASLAVYGVISYSLTIFLILVSAVAQYFLPIFVKNSNNYEKFKIQVYRSQFLLSSICIIFIIISYIFGDWILLFVYGGNYKDLGSLLCLVFVATLFKSLSAILGTAMTSLRVYNFQLKFTLFSLVLTVMITPFLINIYGISGAFYSLISVNFIELLFYLYFANRNFDKVIKNIDL